MSKNKSDIIDIAALIRSYISKWYLFAISVVLCLLVSVYIIKTRSRDYGVRANVLIQIDDTNAMSSLGAVGDLFGSKGKVDDEVFVISSHSLLRDVVKKLNLNEVHTVKRGFFKKEMAYPHAPLKLVTEPGVADTISTGIIFDVEVDKNGLANVEVKIKKETVAEVEDKPLPVTVNTPYGAFTIQKTKYFENGKPLDDVIGFSGYHAAAEVLATHVQTSIASKKSNAIELAINTSNPTFGCDILNTVIELYNQRGIREKNLTGEKTAKFINDRLAILNQSLNEAEVAVEQYKRAHNMTNLDVDLKYNTEKRGDLEKSLLNAETRCEILKISRDFLSNPDNAYALVPYIIPDMSNTLDGYNNLVVRRMQLAESARPDNAALKQLSQQIDVMRRNIITSVDRSLANAHVSLAEIKAEKRKTDGELGSMPTQEREFITIKREQQVKQNIYTFLLQRNEETNMLLANAVPKGIIVDEAYTLKDPLGMSSKMILLLGFIFGMALPPIYLFAKKIIREKFETREEAEKIIDAPVLGEMCNVRGNEKVVVGNGKSASEAELFRLMRTNLLFMLHGSNDKVVLMTSSRSGEGKSFLSINLAASLAMLENKKVLLVGMDIRKPQLANYLDIAPSPGLTEYLAGSGVSLKQLIRHDVPVPNMDVIVAGPVPPNPSELLASDRVDELFRELRTMYDYIVVDSAPIGMVSDSFSLNRIADACVFVTRVNYSHISDLNFINKIYEEQRLKKLSVIVNGTQGRLGYGYGYGYGYGHDKKKK